MRRVLLLLLLSLGLLWSAWQLPRVQTVGCFEGKARAAPSPNTSHPGQESPGHDGPGL